MWPRLRKSRAQATAVADPLEVQPVEQLREEIEELTERNRRARDSDLERRLLRLRHLAGARLLDDAAGDPQFAGPDSGALRGGDPLPEHARHELSAGLLRAGILRDGCVLIRQLVPRTEALRFAAQIARAYELREQAHQHDGYYEEFQPDERFEAPWRPWIEMGGGLLAADSPRLSFEMMELFGAADLPQTVSEYLGEPALISVHKTTLRKAEPSVSGAWHQDGFFMGPVRSLNLWLSLSRCGDEAPGLDLLPRRLERYVATGTDGAELEWTISNEVVREAADGTPVLRPIFEPGDALFFDELFLHKTGSDPAMPKPRFAVENWFFSGSGFPAEYAPLAV